MRLIACRADMRNVRSVALTMPNRSPRCVGHSNPRNFVNAYPSLRPVHRRRPCRRGSCLHRHRGLLGRRYRARPRHSVAGTGGRLVRQHLAIVCAGVRRPRRRRRLRHHAGAPARRLGADVEVADVHRARDVRRPVRLDRRQHLAIRDRLQRAAGAAGGDADAADAEARRQEPRSDAEGGQLRRPAAQSARHQHRRNGETARSQGPR